MMILIRRAHDELASTRINVPQASRQASVIGYCGGIMPAFRSLRVALPGINQQNTSTTQEHDTWTHKVGLDTSWSGSMRIDQQEALTCSLVLSSFHTDSRSSLDRIAMPMPTTLGSSKVSPIKASTKSCGGWDDVGWDDDANLLKHPHKSVPYYSISLLPLAHASAVVNSSTYSTIYSG